MLRFTIIVTFSLLLSSLSGCSNSSADMMARAESLMDENPDYAMSLIDSIDTRTLRLNSDRALYALLKSQALDKSYRYVTDDSLIRIATDFFDRTNDIRRQMLAHYYLARVYFESEKEDLKSCIEFVKAEELANQISDHYYLGLIYRNLSALHLRNYNINEAYCYSEKSLNEFKQTDKELHTKYAFLNLARAQYNTRDIDKGIYTLNRKEVLDWAADDPAYNYSRLRILLPLYLINRDSANSICTLRMMEKNEYFQPDMRYYAYAAEVYLNYIHDLKQGKNFMDSISSGNDPIDSRILLNDLNVIYFTNTHDFKKALEARNAMMELQDSIVTLSLNRSLISAQKDILEQESKLRESRLQKDRIISISFIIGLILLIAIGSLIFIISYRKRKAETADAVAALQSLRDELLRNHSDSEKEIKHQINSLINSQLQAIDKILAAYYLNQPSDSASKLNKTIEQTVIYFRSEECISNLRQIIDRYNNHLITRLHNCFPTLKSDDLVFMTYIFAGFSPRSVCLFTNTPYKYYYTRTTRLRQYFSLSQHPDGDTFIEELTRANKKK